MSAMSQICKRKGDKDVQNGCEEQGKVDVAVLRSVGDEEWDADRIFSVRQPSCPRTELFDMKITCFKINSSF